MPRGAPISNLPRALEALGDRAVSARTLAYQLGLQMSTIMAYVRGGDLVEVGRTKGDHPWDRRGVAILCAPEHAAKHRKAAA